MFTKRFPVYLALFALGVVMMGANGCSSNPYVEGAKLDIRNEDYDRALESLNTALDEEPENAEAYQLKGDVYRAMAFEAGVTVDEFESHINNMLDAYDQAVQYDPELADVIQRAKRIAYLQTFQEGAQGFERGQTDEGAYVEAAAYFDTAAMIQPDSIGAYVNEAYALLNAGMPADAIEPFETAVEMGDDRVDTYIYLSQLYATEGRTADAVALLEDAQVMWPENAELQSQLLNAYVQAGMTDRALEQYAMAVEQFPDNPLYRYNYGSLLLEMERYDEAISQLQAASDLEPENADAYYNLGAAYVNQAVIVNDRISELVDQVREDEGLTAAEEAAISAELEELDVERSALFEAAITPLERARELALESGEDTAAMCMALFQAYVQVGRESDAEAVTSCAGYDE